MSTDLPPSSSPGSATEHHVPAAPAAMPPVAPSPQTADEVFGLLLESKGQISDVAACIRDGVTDRKEMVEMGAAANTGAVGNLLTNIAAIRDGEIPAAPTMARNALSASRSFLKQHRSKLSPTSREHLERVIEQLEDVVDDPVAAAKEEEAIEQQGDQLEEVLARAGGVYVYTYPHYWRYPTVEGTRRTLLKVGMTTKDAAARVRDQARATGIPEDPLLLRVYRSSSRTPQEVEKAFHRLLTAADHDSLHKKRGGAREWFETSVEFLDTIAGELGLEATTADTSGQG